MTTEEQMLHIEQRIFNVRKTVAQVCVKAGVNPSSWSRAKRLKAVSVDTMLRMERALDDLEKERTPCTSPSHSSDTGA